MINSIIPSCLFVYSIIFQDVLFYPPKKYFVVTFLATVGIESVVCEDPFITDSPWNCVFWRSWWRLYQPVNGFQILQDLLGETKKRQKMPPGYIHAQHTIFQSSGEIGKFVVTYYYLFFLDKHLFDGAVLFLEMLNHIVFMSASIHLF